MVMDDIRESEGENCGFIQQKDKI